MTLLFLIPAIMLWSQAQAVSAENLFWSSILLFVLGAGCACFELVTFLNWMHKRKVHKHQVEWQTEWEAMMSKINREDIKVNQNDYFL